MQIANPEDVILDAATWVAIIILMIGLVVWSIYL